MTEYKEIGGQPCYSDDGWKTFQVGIKEYEPNTIGNLSDLNTTRKDTYSDYYKRYPDKAIELILGKELKWYQKVLLRSMLKPNKS
jgi:hypothetical protein